MSAFRGSWATALFLLTACGPAVPTTEVLDARSGVALQAVTLETLPGAGGAGLDLLWVRAEGFLPALARPGARVGLLPREACRTLLHLPAQPIGLELQLDTEGDPPGPDATRGAWGAPLLSALPQLDGDDLEDARVRCLRDGAATLWDLRPEGVGVLEVSLPPEGCGFRTERPVASVLWDAPAAWFPPVTRGELRAGEERVLLPAEGPAVAGRASWAAGGRARLFDLDPADDGAEPEVGLEADGTFRVPCAATTPACLSLWVDRDPGLREVGQVDGVLPRDSGVTWVGEVEAGRGTELVLAPRLAGPAEGAVSELRLDLFQSGARSMRRPGSSHSVRVTPGAPWTVRGLPADVWRVAVEPLADGAEDLWVDGAGAELLQVTAVSRWEPQLLVRPAATLDMRLPETWTARGLHVLTLVDEHERHDLPLDLRPDGRIAWGVPPRVPCGSFWAYLRSDRQDVPERDAAWARLEVRTGEAVTLEPSVGLLLVEEPRPGQAGRPRGRPLLLAGPDGRALGPHARVLTRRRQDGSAVSGVLTVDMRLLDEETGELVYDRGEPAPGYTVE